MTNLKLIIGASCILINAMVAQAQIPPLEEFCSLPECPGSADLVPALNSRLSSAFPSTTGTCGDSVCDVFRGETCMTCPQDCGGACQMSAPLRQCNQPNHFALTFDDGPGEFTQQALAILQEYNVKATFFVNGYQTVARASDVTAMFNAGHVVGSHTYSHRSLSSGQGSSSRVFTSLPYSHMQGELLGNDAAIYAIIGKYPRFVRPPYLEFSSTSMAFMETSGYTPVNINVDSNDWRVTDPQLVETQTRDAFANARTSPSWIHLQHDTMGHSINALPNIIKNLQADNVEFVTMEQCLGQSAYRAETDSPFLSTRLQNNAIGGRGEIVDDVGSPSTSGVPATREVPVSTEAPDTPGTTEVPISNGGTPAVEGNTSSGAPTASGGSTGSVGSAAPGGGSISVGGAAISATDTSAAVNPSVSPSRSGASTGSVGIESEMSSCGQHGLSPVAYAIAILLYALH